MLSQKGAFEDFEEEAYRQGFSTPVGVDEAGRGPLAGPVVAAACFLPVGVDIPGIHDSKLLTARQREAAYALLIEHPQVRYAIARVDAEIIDQINIYQATMQAMSLALEGLTPQPDYLLVDGMPLQYNGLPYEKIIKGDRRCRSIAAASILAKVYRDRLMHEYHQKWPHYAFAAHKGYGTAKHREALMAYGPCPIHRKTFAPIREKLWQKK